jgi:multiple sugar transport system permease protein
MRKTLSYLALGIAGLLMLLPLVWMLSTSLKSPDRAFTAFDTPGKALWPGALHFGNYAEVYRATRPMGGGFARWYFNSLFVALAVTAGQVATSACAAYAFARLQFPGRDKLFLGYLGTMMVPAVVTMIPNFILMSKLGALDSYFALIVPAMFSAYGTFLLRQFFLTIPRELEEAAAIDGCGPWRIFATVILPLSKPALATLAIFTFMGNWRSFMWPLVMTSQDALKTLPVGLQTFLGLYNTQWTLLMAGAAMMTLPVIIVFVIGQKWFISGIQMGALKG